VKIVHFIKWLRLRDGGTVRAVLDMCAGLASRGHEVIACSADDSGVPDAWKGPRAAGLPSNLLLELRDPLFERRGRTMDQATRDTLTQHLPASSLALAREALRGADALHVHGVWANTNHQMIRLARSMGVPHVISPHGMLDHWSMSQGSLKKRLHMALLSGRSIRTARAIHCTAQAELDQACDWFPRSIGRVIPLLFDTSPFHALPGPQLARETFPWLAADRPTVLFLSRLNVKKGVEHLLHALANSKRSGAASYRLVLAGPSDPPEYRSRLQSLVAELGLADDVHFPGMVNGPLKWSLYQAADLFALPTSQENFGYVLLEALACATPIITTTGVDIWPELEASGGASIIKGESLVNELASAIDTLLTDAPRRRSMGDAGRAWALRFLDRERILDAMEAMYAGRA
jgi:glycosyltransferase involved in cell wall biosynthesis